MGNGVSVKEPEYDIIAQVTNVEYPYDLRSYGTRFAVKTPSCGGNSFSELADYIGVTSTPANNRKEKISMTAPVVMTPGSEDECGEMMFILPEEYDDMSKIPVPTDADVTLEELDPVTGAAYFYSWWDTPERRAEKLDDLLTQLEVDGVPRSEIDEYKCEAFVYDAPLTLPWTRRNEIWCPLTEEQVTALTES